MAEEDDESQENELLALSSIYTEHELITTEDNGLRSGHFNANIELPDSFAVRFPELDIGGGDVDGKEIAAAGLDGAESKTAVHNLEYLPPVELNFELPKNYPSKAPPVFTLSAKWLSLKQLTELCKKLDRIWIENEGMEVLFMWISFLKDELLDFLNLSSPLDLSSVIPLRKRLRRKTEENVDIANNLGSDSSHHESKGKGNCYESSSKSTRQKKPKSPIFDAEEAHKRRNKQSQPIRERPGHDKVKNNDAERNTKCKELTTDNAKTIDGDKRTNDRGQRYDKRAIRSIANRQALLPALIEFNEIEKQRRFELTCFTCSICFSEKYGGQCLKFYDCGHVYCQGCMAGYFEVMINDGNVKALTCPNDKCESQATPAQVKELVPVELFEKYDRLLLQTTLDTMADVVYCPRVHCQSPVVKEPDTTMGRCAACHYVFCTFCKYAYHGISACKIKPDEIKKLRAEYNEANDLKKKLLEKRYGKTIIRHIIEESESLDWLDQYSKQCPSCGTNIQKIDGCNKMSCTKCRNYFCWLCMATLNHGNPYSHFNSLGSPCFNQLFQGVETNEWEVPEEEQERNLEDWQEDVDMFLF
ncbi:unnamed protein product [Owenia fusiformis]|uniref:RBR-type E3 ubiquitin transferase n=1 Tax=Owenia fusiformis TaxID=6347 RepID=A0A8J1Y8W5_OWEFU|nr:unnamed protein product [Owenia fusiformis]